MADAGIAAKARFDLIRYAQVWEDADVLVAALRGPPGRSFLSVCSAGDNALALLVLDPQRVVVRDLAEAQLHCLRIRIAAMQELAWPEFAALLQPAPGGGHRTMMERVLPRLDPAGRAFWETRLDAVAKLGLAGVGRFEHYFAVFRRWVLPLIHTRRTVHDVFMPRAPADRAAFFARRWDTWRWRLATNLFFSRFTMGRLGRDPSFFAHAEGSLPAQVRRKVRDAAVALDPSANPYMQWILLGRNRGALPLAWREEHYETIRSRTDRIEIGCGRIDQATPGGFDGFNLSDVFEYMAADEFAATYGRLLQLAEPRARLVYWNMMAPRRLPARYAGVVRRDHEAEARLKAADKAFFYADLVIEDVS
jgi:S-adenosylmethionine-diacylglycerol 3-amino-3-carboxypropyl transferase